MFRVYQNVLSDNYLNLTILFYKYKTVCYAYLIKTEKKYFSCDSMAKLKSSLPSIKLLLEDSNYFKQIYTYAFHFSLVSLF